jgi:hypothetical protein
MTNISFGCYLLKRLLIILLFEIITASLNYSLIFKKLLEGFSFYFLSLLSCCELVYETNNNFNFLLLFSYLHISALSKSVCLIDCFSFAFCFFGLDDNTWLDPNE